MTLVQFISEDYSAPTVLMRHSKVIPPTTADFIDLKVSSAHFAVAEEHISFASFRFLFFLLLSVIGVSDRISQFSFVRWDLVK